MKFKIGHPNIAILVTITVASILIHVFDRSLTLSYTIAGIAFMIVMMDYLTVIEKKIDKKEDKK